MRLVDFRPLANWASYCYLSNTSERACSRHPVVLFGIQQGARVLLARMRCLWGYPFGPCRVVGVDDPNSLVRGEGGCGGEGPCPRRGLMITQQQEQGRRNGGD